MDANAVSAALESVLIRGSEGADDGTPYVFTCKRSDGTAFWAVVFNATNFAIRDPDEFAAWMMGKADPNLPLDPPHESDKKAVRLLPKRLQKKIKDYENQQSKNYGTEDEDAAKAESASQRD